ncbi:MAG: ComF family protein [Planctomycetota bacterium]|jgi:ComF family protein
MATRGGLTPALQAGRFVARGLAELLLPSACPGCLGAPAGAEGLCGRCNVELLRLVSLPYCIRCGATLGPNVPGYDEGCAACPNPLPRFVRVVRLGPYAGPFRRGIRQIKYRRDDALRRRFGALLAQAVSHQCPGETFDFVAPVPAHWQRRLMRGSDHTLRLARSTARPMDLLISRDLVRVRPTSQQIRLSRTKRFQNVRGAFAVRRPESIAGANVLLIDDVTTTGATASEASRTLLRAGALRVTLAVVAKGESPVAYSQRREG